MNNVLAMEVAQRDKDLKGRKDYKASRARRACVVGENETRMGKNVSAVAAAPLPSTNNEFRIR